MPGNAKVNGTWKELVGVNAKVNGSWKEIIEAYTKVNNEWKLWLKSAREGIAGYWAFNRDTGEKLIYATGTWSSLSQPLFIERIGLQHSGISAYFHRETEFFKRTFATDTATTLSGQSKFTDDGSFFGQKGYDNIEIAGYDQNSQTENSSNKLTYSTETQTVLAGNTSSNTNVDFRPLGIRHADIAGYFAHKFDGADRGFKRSFSTETITNLGTEPYGVDNSQSGFSDHDTTGYISTGGAIFYEYPFSTETAGSTYTAPFGGVYQGAALNLNIEAYIRDYQVFGNGGDSAAKFTFSNKTWSTFTNPTTTAGGGVVSENG